MKKKWLLLLVCLLGISIISYFGLSKFHREELPTKSQQDKAKNAPYFEVVSVTKFTAADLPCIPIQIGGKRVSLELDLGFRGDLEFCSEFLVQIPEIKYLSSKTMYGFRGHEAETKLYAIPEIKMGRMTFYRLIAQEDAGELSQHSSIVKEGHERSFDPEIKGKAGWELFCRSNLFLDLKNSKIAGCDSFATLEKQGYPAGTFVKTPLLSERGLVEFNAITPNGPLLCVLDTGSTWNILNTELEQGKTIEQVVWEPDNALKFVDFKIGDVDFGKMEFHRFPINLPIHLAAILGMEFFKEHLVFLDFDEGQIYIAPAPSP